MAEKKELTLIQQQGKEEKIKYEFYRTMAIEIEAINEIQNDKIKLIEFKKLNKKYNDLLTEWYELFGIVNNPDIMKVFRVSELHKKRGTEYFNKERKKLQEKIYPIGRVIEKLEFKTTAELNFQIAVIKEKEEISLKQKELLELKYIELRKLEYIELRKLERELKLKQQKEIQKSKLQTEKKIEPLETIENNSINDFPEIFAETGFQTFKMLNEKYKKDNKKLKAKYSNLFWFLKKEDLLKCTQLEYIDFINENYSVKLSKILPQTAKYEDIIQPLLMRYLAGQQ